MANNRKRLIASTLRRDIASDCDAFAHWEWVEEVAGGAGPALARSWQKHLADQLSKHLSTLWEYRINPKQLRLSEWVLVELENWDEWYEYLHGIPADPTQAESRWSRRLYGGAE